MFCLLLLVSEMGILAAELRSTPQTMTVFKNLALTETFCGGECNTTTCSLRIQNLEEIPTCIPHSVETLDLIGNKLTAIWDQNITDFSELRHLYLAHNQIKDVLWKSNVLPQLEVLDLSYNKLLVAPKCLILKKVTWLSLSGNPISHIGPFTFTCFPNLAHLYLSSTLIGINSSPGIEESAFALNETITQEESLKSLQLLDLSNTYISRVEEAWSKDLPNLKELYLRNMINMESLADELIQWFPHLEHLNCDNSWVLTQVITEMFGKASKLKYLSFQNCNLTAFPPWNVTSGTVIVDLSGNPLICDCELAWLYSHPAHLTLTREYETFCNPFKGDSAKVTLLENYHNCQRSKLNQHPNMSPSTVTNTNNVTATQSPATATQTPQSTSIQPYVPETVKVFKTTAADATNVSPKQHQTSSSVQNIVTVVSENGLIKGSTTSINSTSTRIMYTTESTLVTSKRFTSPARTTMAGSGQPMAEDSSTEEQSDIAREYPEDNEEEESQPDILTNTSMVAACDYDGCRHLQIPCIELQLQRQCSCPGLSGDNVIPDPPHLKNTSEITDTSAQIHWCAPNSVVETYQLVYQPVGDQMKTVDNIYVTMRQYTLYDLTPFTTYKVCIMAFNRGGQSEAENTASGTPCTEFQTKPSYIMILALVGGLCGLFLVIIAGLAVLLYRAYKNTMVNQYNTHLVSYKNPAFEYHLTIPSYH